MNLKPEDYLGKKIDIIIDRELRSKHPKYDLTYPVNYGYVPNTISGDGEELDAYLLGVDVPVSEYKNGEVIAYIHRINDNDDKLIVVPKGCNYTDEEIRKLTMFQEKYFKSVIIRK